MGPFVKVLVGGSLHEDDSTVLRSPERFVANIDQGKIRLGDSAVCAPLPIKGEGLFDGVYLGPRSRIEVEDLGYASAIT